MQLIRWWWGTCRCSHGRDLHLHYRKALDCAECGPEACPKFRRRCLPDLVVWRR